MQADAVDRRRTLRDRNDADRRTHYLRVESLTVFLRQLFGVVEAAEQANLTTPDPIQVEQDSAGVESLFTAQVANDDSVIDIGGGTTVTNVNAGNSFSSLGILPQLERLGTHYLDTVDGLFTLRKKTIDDQIKSQNDQIASLQSRLDQRRVILQRQFLAMEESIGKLQQQQGALGQLG